MKYTALYIVSLLLILIFAGCTSDSNVSPAGEDETINELDVPEDFDWDFTRDVEVYIQTEDSAGNPVAGKAIEVYKSASNLAFSSSTNSEGELKMDITLLESSQSVILKYDDITETLPVIGNEIHKTLIVEPERATRSNGTLYVPGQNSVLSIMFEDMWPTKGDYDFNDMVVESWGKLRYESDYLRYIELQTKVIASGATYHNGFEIMFETTAFPNTALGDVITFTAEDINGNPLFATSAEVNEAYGTDVIWDTYNSQLKFKFFDNVYDVMPRPLSFLAMNTFNEEPWVDPVTIKIRIDYSTSHLIYFDAANPVLNLNALNPYIVVDGVTGYEIHLPGDPYTGSFNQFALFGTGDDITPTNGTASPLYEDQGYRTANGLSWGLKLEGQLEFPREKADVISAYPRLAEYFAGTLGIFENWWQPHPDDDYSEGYVLDRGDLTPAEQNAPIGE